MKNSNRVSEKSSPNKVKNKPGSRLATPPQNGALSREPATVAVPPSREIALLEWLRTMPEGYRPDEDVEIQIPLKLSSFTWTLLAQAASQEDKNIVDFIEILVNNEADPYMHGERPPLGSLYSFTRGELEGDKHFAGFVETMKSKCDFEKRFEYQLFEVWNCRDESCFESRKQDLLKEWSHWPADLLAPIRRLLNTTEYDTVHGMAKELDIPEPLLSQVKRTAKAKGITVNDYFNDLMARDLGRKELAQS